MFSIKDQIKLSRFIYAVNVRTSTDSLRIYTGVAVAVSIHEVLGVLLEDAMKRGERITGWAIDDLPVIPNVDSRMISVYPGPDDETIYVKR